MHKFVVDNNDLTKILRKNKSVLQFLAIFGACYLVLTILYHFYLSVASSTNYYPDFITHLVAEQSQQTISSFGYHAKILPHLQEASMRLFVNEKYLVRIVEGCNAVSVLILFSSFVLAFHGSLKKTILFLLGGSVLIYSLNIFRIALLAIGIYNYPNYQELLHGTVFPVIIYGAVFLLWIFWVRIVSKKTPHA
ncbi:exosortase family protein XrtF [Mesonia aquimarina]|uniref:exosortase family protein XrtF n=1 Tax=Mesonia aquimarina TaxID=1504967 RepID=UPI001F0946BE|nr:exosortase family protein XrtF [Mesonia aquimarina]